MVYSPGDNEWTDCHREKAGHLNPRDRLKRLREIFFGDPAVLRLDALGVSRSGQEDEQDEGAAAYPEIYSFMREQVMFVVLHIVGGNNG